MQKRSTTKPNPILHWNRKRAKVLSMIAPESPMRSLDFWKTCCKLSIRLAYKHCILFWESLVIPFSLTTNDAYETDICRCCYAHGYRFLVSLASFHERWKLSAYSGENSCFYIFSYNLYSILWRCFQKCNPKNRRHCMLQLIGCMHSVNAVFLIIESALNRMVMVP